MPRDKEICNAIAIKMKKVVDRRYVISGRIYNLTGYFHIPKGLGDIRLVYDATKSKLNDAVWAPRFGLPTAEDTTICFDRFIFYG